MASPTLVIGAPNNPDTRVFADAPTVVIFSFIEKFNESGGNYTGDGELAFDPVDAKLELFKDQDGNQPVALIDGKATIANTDLKGNTPFYLKANSDAEPATVNLTLSLKPSSDPKTFATHGIVTKSITLARVNTVTPQMTVTIDSALDNTVWYPSPNAVAPPSITLAVQQTRKDDAAYSGDAVLTCDKAGLELFRDQELTEPLPFFNNRVVIRNVALTGASPLTLYLAGTATADVKLMLTLYDPKQRWFKIGDPQQTTVAVKAVNQVMSRLQYGGIVIPERLTMVKLFITESNGTTYEQNGTLERSSDNLALFTDRNVNGQGENSVFNGTDLTAMISNSNLKQPDKIYYATWTGPNPPNTNLAPGLTLTLPDSDKPYVITDPSKQLRSPSTRPAEISIGGSTTVTPKIETEYDLVLLATSATNPETRTTPVRARFYVERSTPEIPYLQDGRLKRDNQNLRTFFDAECKVEMNFSSNDEATIPNAKLLDKTQIYYLKGVTKGVTAGKTKLTLTAAKPVNSFVSLPPVIVANPAEKELAVVALDLTVFRDAGEMKPATANSVALSKMEQRSRGRFVHVQNAGQYGRAKLVLKQVDTSTWPNSANNHEVRIAIISSRDIIRLYKTETSTDVQAMKDSPAQLSKTTVGNGDNEFFAEGNLVSDDVNDVRIDAGISRTDGGGWEDIKPLNNGDFAVMTSVRISEVRPTGTWRQFVNLPPDPSKTINDNSDDVKKGRHILITSRIDPPKANVGIDVMLWGFDGNGNADNTAPRNPLIPNALKATDRHVTALTDSSGLATSRIELSRYGGDQFVAAAFLADDAAKGEAAAQGNSKPTIAISTEIVVWQKIFYTLAAMARANPTIANPDYSGRANPPGFEATFVPAFIEMERIGNVLVIPHQDILTKNQAKMLGMLPAPTERTANVMLLDTITRDAATSPTTIVIDAPNSETPTKEINNLYDTNNFLDSGALVNRNDNSVIANLPNDKITLNYSGESLFQLQLDIAGFHDGTDLADVKIKIKLRRQTGPSGFTSGTKPFVSVRVREQLAEKKPANDATKSCVHTMAHETGHYLGLKAEKVPDPTQTKNRYWYMGKNDKTTDYNSLKATPPPSGNHAKGPHGTNRTG